MVMIFDINYQLLEYIEISTFQYVMYVLLVLYDCKDMNHFVNGKIKMNVCSTR